MTMATLAQVLQPALSGGYAVAGLVVQGWEDARAYVAAAEAEGLPVILQAGPGARAHMPVAIFGAMFRHLAEAASVPVVAHLDHATTLDDCRTAIDAGFTSVMFDGSRLALAENIARTAEVVALAHAAGVSCEGELGFVGYSGAEASLRTDPVEAARFARETGVDALAVSVGNVHLQTGPEAEIDLSAAAALMAATPVPLVLHGGSGIPPAMRRHLARTTSVKKFNIGTELRQTFGAALRASLADPARFDRIAILRDTEAPLTAAACQILRNLA